MNRNELQELHYISHIENVISILKQGILSHNHMKKQKHISVAMPEIQERRSKKVVPAGRPLHDYVCLYINARNKMLFKIKDRHAEICILRISTDVLDLLGVVITDQNASSDYARFAPAPDGLQIVDRDRVFSTYWHHDANPIETLKHGSIICAEVLVPDSIDPAYIKGAYVSCEEAKRAFDILNTGIQATINSHLFFR